MEIKAGTPVEAITIAGVQGVEVPLPFTTGHTCTVAEAHVLNQTLKENARNNLRERIKKEGADKPAAQKLVDEYIAQYKFGERTGGFRSSDPVETEAMSIARTAISAALVKKGVARKDISSADVTTKARTLLSHPEKGAKLRKRAAAVVKAREADADELLADL